MMLTNRLALLAILVIALAPRAADAQIYVSRDATGALLLSDQKIDAPIAVYSVEGAPTIRTTRPRPAHASRFDSIVQEHASRQALRPELVRAVIQVESGYNPRATSPKGAMGLMQLMPGTARDLGVRDPYDPEENIRGGTRYLRQLLDQVPGQRGPRARRLQRRSGSRRQTRRKGASLSGNQGLRTESRFRRR